MSTYKYGSLKLIHENAGLNVPSIQWLGIQSRDILAGNQHDEYSGLLRLSARDRKKAADMLERSEVLQEGGGMEKVWRRELQVMLMLNLKAEMEVLADRQGGVKGWVEERLLDNGNNLHAYSDLLGMHQLAEVTLDEMDQRGPQADDDFLLDAHETPYMQTDGGDPPNLQGNEDLLETHQLADVTLDGDDLPDLQADENLLEAHQLADDLPSLQADEDFMLDTHEVPDMPAVRGGSQGSQTDENLLDTYEMADVSPADESSASFEWDEEL